MKNTGLLLIALLAFSFSTFAQVYEFKDDQKLTHRILMTEDYLVETVYESNPAKFVLTRGGFISNKGKQMNVNFEFNSNFETDELKEMTFEKSKKWNLISLDDEELEANWLFTSRVRDGKESERRGEESTRKTLKVLLDGYFQWIAYDVANMKFYGSGGGTYAASNGEYIESIQYFSKDNTRVGAILDFNYELIDGEWNHKGLSSKGDPIHEIWVKR